MAVVKVLAQPPLLPLLVAQLTLGPFVLQEGLRQ
jgi:hypothetical protein